VTSTPTVAAPTAIPSKPTTDATGTLVDNGDGTYKYTFYRDITAGQALLDAYTGYDTTSKFRADLGDVSFAPAQTHRLGIQIGGNARGTGTNTPDGSNTGILAVAIKNPANLTYDFIPATGKAVVATDLQRDMIDISSCNSCHTKLRAHGNRVEAHWCVVCHTDQVKYGQAEAVLNTTGNGYTGTATNRVNGYSTVNFPNFIHKIHMGEELKMSGYAGTYKFNETTFPMDQRNCEKCHKATTTAPQGDNWKNVPSRLACGACHDNVNFTSGANHGTLANGGPQLDDKHCVDCHTPANITTAHTSNDMTALNTTTPTGLGNFTYDIQSMTLNASNQPVIKFRISLNGTPVTSFATPTMVNHRTSGRIVVDPNYQPIPNYIGGPSLAVVYGMPQDGITSPADFNVRSSASLTSLLLPAGSPGKTGSLSATADASGYWTATITGDLTGQAAAYTGWVSPATPAAAYSALAPSPITVPAAAAKLVTAGIYGTFTQIDQAVTYPYTNANVTVYPAVAATGGVLRTAMFKKVVATGITGNVGRRVVVDTNKCNACHDQLGTKPNFHGGQATLAAGAVGSGPRNEATACSFCHTVNQTSSGWAANVSTFIHGIHGGGKRTLPFTWHATATSNYSSVTYPALLNNCEQCHVTGSYDFSNSTNAAAIPNLLWTTVGTGTYAAGPSTSPYVQLATPYGGLFSYNVTTGVTTAAAATTLVSSPITAACASCHDSTTAVAHMKNNGGAFYEARSTAFTKIEQCLICHGNGKTADIRAVHMTF